MKVSELHIYPIKSTAPILLQNADINQYGLAHDRSWALYGDDGQVLTGRQHPKLLDITCTISPSSCQVHHNTYLIAELPLTPAHNNKAEPIKIFSYDAYGSVVDLAIDRWFSKFLGISCRLLKVNTSKVRPVLKKHGGDDGDIVGFADQAPILIISEGSLEDLNQRLDSPVLMNRFRPNIIVKDVLPYGEDNWDFITIGTTTLRVIQQCERCVFTTIDPTSKTKDKNNEPLATLSRYRKGPRGGIIFGVHAVPIITGTIHINDDVKVSSLVDRPIQS